MPAPVTVTTDQVAQAAEQLAGLGKRITGWALRGVIGAGRPDRLEAVWREQKGSQPAPAPPEQDKPALPPAVAEHLAAAEERIAVDLRGLVGQAWRQAADLAARRVQDEVDGARARVAALEDEQAEAARVIEEADWRAAVLQEELDAARGEAGAARMEAARVQQVAREQAAAHDARLADAQRAVEDLRMREEAATRRAAEADEAMSAARADAAGSKAYSDAADSAALEARQERDAARQETAAAREDMDTARRQAAGALEEARAVAGQAREGQVRAEALAEGATARALAAEGRALAADERMAAAVATMAAQAAVSRTPAQDDGCRGIRDGSPLGPAACLSMTG